MTWHHYEDSCYLFSHEKLNWFNAQGSCRAHDARLAEVMSSKQQEFLRYTASLYGNSSGFWLGGRDDIVDGKWQWSFTKTFFVYTDWAPLEPANGLFGNCLQMWSAHNWQWDDTDCLAEMRYVCESKPTKENAVPTLFAYNNYKTGTPRDTKNSTLRPIEQLILTTQPANIVTVSQLPKVPRQKKYIPDIPVISYIEKPSLDHTYCTSTEVSEDVSIEEKCVMLIENSNTLEQKCQRYETDNNQLRKQVKLLQVELHATKEENKVLNEKFNNTDELLKDKLVEKLTKSNSNVKCFLGLPSISMLFGIFKLLEGHASKMKYWMGPDSSDGKRWQVNNKKKPGASRKLTFFEEFVITLLRLRLGLNTYVLSLLFGVSQSTISRVFTTWISLMAQCLGPLIKWPSKEKIKKHMPLSFRRKYPNTRVIIDATEFYVQRPRNPTAQSKTWSNYKSKNTFKTLVGITPNGAFSFISDLWTGNISDRSITERSGFIDLIEKGDHVMADRGFLIKDLLLSKGATLNMPPFTRPCKHGKGRCLTAKEIKESKSIASLRIHVERSIQRLKSYKFLSGVMPINSLSVANQALKVAGFFCNLMKPLVQKL
ncbi:unnamed protein product [Mytilus edulis]|uniref:C-type lectin domain-containing protein n=2 Tax=Mytilus TaxID=6548 RepID=A0A8S3TJD1_MYTED|nr:unnamed protein product [Mytilus edulis]